MDEFYKDIKDALPKRLDSSSNVQKVEQSLQTSIAALQDQQSDDKCLLLLKSGIMYLIKVLQLLTESAPWDLKNSNILNLVLDCLVAANEHGKRSNNFVVSCVASRCLDIVLSDQFAFLSRMEVLTKLNFIFESTDMAAKEKFVQIDSCLSKLKQLFQLIHDIGDYEFQVCIMEYLFRVLPRKLRQKYSSNIIQDPQVLQAFLAVKDSHFEVDCRKFLNRLNSIMGEDRNVYSFPCHKITFGPIELQKPCDEGYNDFWVDLNMGSKRLVIFCENAQFSSQVSASQDCWDTVSVWQTDVHKFVCQEEEGVLHAKIHIQPTARCVPRDIDFDNRPVLHIVTDTKHNLQAALVQLFSQKKVSDVINPIQFMIEDVSQEPHIPQDIDSADGEKQTRHKKSTREQESPKPPLSRKGNAFPSQSVSHTKEEKVSKLSAPSVSSVSSHYQESRSFKASVPLEVMATPASSFTLVSSECGSVGSKGNTRRAGSFQTDNTPNRKKVKTPLVMVTKPSSKPVKSDTKKMANTKFVPPSTRSTPHATAENETSATEQKAVREQKDKKDDKEAEDSPPNIVIPDSLPFPSQAVEPSQPVKNTKRQKKAKDASSVESVAGEKEQQLQISVSAFLNAGSTSLSQVSNSKTSNKLTKSAKSQEVARNGQGRTTRSSQMNKSTSESLFTKDPSDSQQKADNKPLNRNNGVKPPQDRSHSKPQDSSYKKVQNDFDNVLFGSEELEEVSSSFEEFKAPKSKKNVTGQAKKTPSDMSSSKPETQASQKSKNARDTQAEPAGNSQHKDTKTGFGKGGKNINSTAHSVLQNHKTISVNIHEKEKSNAQNEINVMESKGKTARTKSKVNGTSDCENQLKRILRSEKESTSESFHQTRIDESSHQTRSEQKLLTEILKETSSGKQRSKNGVSMKKVNLTEMMEPSADNNNLMCNGEKSTESQSDNGNMPNILETDRTGISFGQTKGSNPHGIRKTSSSDGVDRDNALEIQKTSSSDETGIEHKLQKNSKNTRKYSDNNSILNQKNKALEKHCDVSIQPSDKIRTCYSGLNFANDCVIEHVAHKSDHEKGAEVLKQSCQQQKGSRGETEDSVQKINVLDKTAVSKKKEQNTPKDKSACQKQKKNVSVNQVKSQRNKTVGETRMNDNTLHNADEFEYSGDDTSDQIEMIKTDFESEDDDTTDFRFDQDNESEKASKNSSKQISLESLHATPAVKKAQKNEMDIQSDQQNSVAQHRQTIHFPQTELENKYQQKVEEDQSMNKKKNSRKKYKRANSLSPNVTRKHPPVKDNKSTVSAPGQYTNVNLSTAAGLRNQNSAVPPARNLRKRQPKSYKEPDNFEDLGLDDDTSSSHNHTFSRSKISDRKLVLASVEQRMSGLKENSIQKTFTMSISSFQAKTSADSPAEDPYNFDESDIETIPSKHIQARKYKSKNQSAVAEPRNWKMWFPSANEKFHWDDDNDNDADAEGSQESETAKKHSSFRPAESVTQDHRRQKPYKSQKQPSVHRQSHSMRTLSRPEESLHNASDAGSPTDVNDRSWTTKQMSHTPSNQILKRAKHKAVKSTSPENPTFSLPFSLYKSAEKGVCVESFCKSPKQQHKVTTPKSWSEKANSPLDITTETPNRFSGRPNLSGGGKQSRPCSKSKTSFNSALRQWTSLSETSLHKKLVKPAFSHSLPATSRAVGEDPNVDSEEDTPPAKMKMKIWEALETWTVSHELSPLPSQNSPSCTLEKGSPVKRLNKRVQKLQQLPVREGGGRKKITEPGHSSEKLQLHDSSEATQPRTSTLKRMSDDDSNIDSGGKEEDISSKIKRWCFPSQELFPDPANSPTISEKSKRKRNRQPSNAQPPKKISKKNTGTSAKISSVETLSLSEDETLPLEIDRLSQPEPELNVEQPVTGIASLLQGFNFDMQKQFKEREHQVQELAMGALKLSNRRITNLWTSERTKRDQVLNSFKDRIQAELSDLEQDVVVLAQMEKSAEAIYLKQLTALHDQREKLQNRVKSVMESHEDFRMETEQVDDQNYEAQRVLEVQMKQDMEQVKSKLLLDMQQQQLRRVKESLQKHFV